MLVPPTTRDQTPTTKLVAAVLAEFDGEGGLTKKELTARTGASGRAIDSAISDLREKGVLETRPHPSDGRMRRYRLTKTGSETETESAG